MNHFSFIIGDIALQAEFQLLLNEDDSGYSEVVDIYAYNTISKECGYAIWTKEQWRAVLILIADGDYQIIGGDLISYFYKIAEPAIKMLPESCRVIP